MVLIIATLIVSLSITAPSISAHSGGIFTIVISKNGIAPTNANMMINDTARWIDVDSTENVTHRIFVDANGNGNYFEDNDWDSGNLTNSCETDANGTKIDEDCNAFFDVPFNYTDADGKYPFVDIVSTGEKIYGNITVNPDVHLTPGFQNEEPEKDVDTETEPQWLLIIAAISGMGAVILGAMIVFGKKNEE
jgi:hypothetical protein